MGCFVVCLCLWLKLCFCFTWLFTFIDVCCCFWFNFCIWGWLFCGNFDYFWLVLLIWCFDCVDLFEHVWLVGLVLLLYVCMYSLLLLFSCLLFWFGLICFDLRFGFFVFLCFVDVLVIALFAGKIVAILLIELFVLCVLINFCFVVIYCSLFDEMSVVWMFGFIGTVALTFVLFTFDYGVYLDLILLYLNWCFGLGILFEFCC